MTASLESIARNARDTMGIYCGAVGCHHSADVSLVALMAAYGGCADPYTLPFRCAKCGGRKFSIIVYTDPYAWRCQNSAASSPNHAPRNAGDSGL